MSFIKNNINAFHFLDLFKNGAKSFQNKNDFNEFLNLDLNIHDSIGWTPTSHILCSNKNFKYHLSPEQIMQICEKSDITIKNFLNKTYLFYVLTCNKANLLNLNTQQILTLLEKANLTQIDIYEQDKLYFQYILENNKEQKLGFTAKQLIELYHKTIQALDNKNMKPEKTQFIDTLKILYPNFISLYEKNQLTSNKIKNSKYIRTII